MADDDVQTKTGGGAETTGGATGVTGATGTTGSTAPSPAPVHTDQTPKTEPDEALAAANNNNNNNADVEAQQMKTGIATPLTNEMGIKTFDCMIARRLFVQKVFGMVGIMLAVVAFMTMLPFASQNFRIFFFRNSWLCWLAYAFYLLTYIPLVCCGCSKRKPLNYILTGILVFAMGWMTIGITIQADTEVILIALVMTTVCCAATIAFAMTTKFDMTQCGPLLCLISLVMFVFFIVAMIAALVFKVYWLYTVYAGLMTLLMMAYLAYDVQMMIGGKRVEISVNDPFYAAIQIFLDIVLMFWYMVQFIQGIKGN